MTESWKSHAYVDLWYHPTLSAIPSEPEWITAPFDLAITWVELDGGRAWIAYWWYAVWFGCAGLDPLQAAFPDAHVKGAYVPKGEKWSPIGLAPDPPDTHFCS